MVLAGQEKDPVRATIERVLVSQQEAVVILVTEHAEFEGRVLPVFVDLGQALNIQVAIEGRMVGRPLTHDLFTNVLNDMNASVERVVIEEIAQNTFFANLSVTIERNGKPDSHTFDARPSDCLALAVRAGAPIFVRRKVLESAAVAREKIFGAEGSIENVAPPPPPADETHQPKAPTERIDPGDLERP